MRILRSCIITILTILSLLPAVAAGERQDSLIVSLITCAPGKEVYELCGHEAVRVRGTLANGTPVDSVWNYGVFDFNAPNFLYRFVKGETDYMLAAYPFEWFMPEYVSGERSVYEQDLNLTPQETSKLVNRLREEAKPENRVYRYNYVKDNCATRIVDRLDENTSSRIIYPDSIHFGTFRREMRAYHHDYPWYQFAIDFALGSGIDYNLMGREEMFVPEQMMRKADYAHFEDGRPLVKQSRILYQGVEDPTLGPTPWYLAPIFISCVFFCFVVIACVMQFLHKKIWRWLNSLWFFISGLVGTLVAFLVFISVHEATSPNILLLWLNPLQLILAVSIWWPRKLRILNLALAYLNIIAIGIMLIVWPVQQQVANVAFFPLMGCSLMLSATYAIIYQKKGYINNNVTEVSNLGAGSHGGASGRRAGRSKPTTSRSRNRR